MIDLHVHSTESDGTLSPEEIAARAAALGLDAIALADHDTTGGIEPATRAAKGLGLQIVPAVEVNTDCGDTEVHVLGYFIEPGARTLESLLEQIRSGRRERNRLIIARLRALGVLITETRVLEIAGKGSVCRPHIAAAMVEAGYCRSMNDAFDRFIGRGGPAYIPRIGATPQQAVEAIRAAGGIPVIAHPLKVRDDSLVESVLDAGAAGIEAFHCDQTPERQRHYIAMASRGGLVVTGGSDSHGPLGARPIEIGSVPIPEWVWPQLLAARERTRG